VNAADRTIASTSPDADKPPAATVSLWQRVDRLLDRGSEWLNPILVKEARQALKSRQFLVTFSLLLACGWLWSVFGVVLQWPDIQISPSGRYMLVGYYIVLALPLLVVVPFSAFRSLSGEREDGTYELLSITALNARQIVTGKLGSATLQMIVYFSALSPCMAFTYLLRGVDVLTILLVLGHTFLISLMLSQIGLLLATFSREAHMQVLLSVLFVVALVLGAVLVVVTVSSFLVEVGQVPATEPHFWSAHLCYLSVYISYLLLFLWASAAQLSFASENRSTRLRYALLAQQALLLGWAIYYWVTSDAVEFLYTLAAAMAVQWFLVGTLLTCEIAELSPRVRRRLPQTFLGRMFLTWFNPGSGTGYLFVVLSLLALAVVLMEEVFLANANAFSGVSPITGGLVWFLLLAWAYVAAYLGVGRLVILALRRVTRVGLVGGTAVHLGLAAFGVAAPYCVHLLMLPRVSSQYSAMQLTNWLWTMNEALHNRIGNHPAVSISLMCIAVLLVLANLLTSTHEIRQVRSTTPRRVTQDERAIHPPKPAPAPAPADPWEADAAADAAADANPGSGS
jgi:ABC-type transport system involved in multi-copper enzyme maturation permease subunit